MNARDRKNHVDDTLDNLLLITEELREELKELEISSGQKMDEMRKENVLLRKTLNEILDVSLRLRSHTPYSGQEIGIGNASGGFVLQIADEPMFRSFPADPSPPSSHTPSSSSANTTVSSGSSPATSPQANSRSSAATTTTPLQSSYDFHHEHHQLGHPEPQDEYILIDQPQTLSPPQPIKKSRWDNLSLPWSSSSSSSGSSSSSPSAV
jgi:hypothetical protein